MDAACDCGGGFMDQRRVLKKSLAKEKGVAELPDSALVEFKELVTEVLTKHVGDSAGS